MHIQRAAGLEFKVAGVDGVFDQCRQRRFEKPVNQGILHDEHKGVSGHFRQRVGRRNKVSEVHNRLLIKGNPMLFDPSLSAVRARVRGFDSALAARQGNP